MTGKPPPLATARDVGLDTNEGEEKVSISFYAIGGFGDLNAGLLRRAQVFIGSRSFRTEQAAEESTQLREGD